MLTSNINCGIYTNMNMKNDNEAQFDERLEFREWDTYNLGEDLELDKYALDIAAQEQAHKYQKWSELLVQEQAKVSKLKEELANREAELTLKVRRDGVPDIPKPTETVYKAWVQTQNSYKRILADKRKAENNVAYLQNALRALEHLKAMIKVEDDLWITGYFARPHISEDVREELDEHRRVQHATKLKKSMEKRHLRQMEDE